MKYFDKALSIDKSNETILKNRAVCEAECIRSRLKIEVVLRSVKPHHLELINKALKILPEECERRKYLNVKAEILDQLGEPVKATVCRALAVKHYDEVEEAESQLKQLKTG